MSKRKIQTQTTLVPISSSGQFLFVLDAKCYMLEKKKY